MKIFKNDRPANASESPAVEPEIEPVAPQPVETQEQVTPKVPDIESQENEDTMISTLENLREQINSLRAEKARIIESEEQLRVKIETEIESKKHNIEGLKAEIPVLKQRCEKLATLLQIPVCK